MRLTIVRHGESEGNAQARVSGTTDHPLTERGKTQAAQAAGALADESFDAIYVSDLTRARQTAAPIIAAHPNARISYDARLRERDFGVYENRPSADVAGIDIWDEPENGEAYAQFRARITDLLDELWEKHRDEHVLLVSHGGLITHLLLELTGRSRSDYREFLISNTGITRVEFDLERNHEIIALDDTRHRT